MRTIQLLLMIPFGLANVGIAIAADCRVSFHLYNSRGESLRGEVVELSYIRDNGDRYLPKQAQRATFRFEKYQIVFGREPNPGDRFWVRLKEATGGILEDRFYFGYCGQRQSIVRGSSEFAGGEGFSRVIGKLSGCREFRDWWVKLMPMFGSQEHALNPEGDVDIWSGEFKLAGNFPGVRHALIVGRGREVITVTAVDISRGGTSMLTELKLGGLCLDKNR